MQAWLNIRRNLMLIALFATAVVFCWHKQWSSIPISFLVLFFLCSPTILLDIKKALAEKAVQLALGIFLLYALGILWATDTQLAAAALERKLSFIIFPIIFAAGYGPNKKYLSIIMDAFCISCFGAMLYCEYIAYHNYTTNLPLNPGWFMYELLSMCIMHPGYFSNLFVVAILWLLFTLSSSVAYHSNLSKWLRITLLILFVAFLATLTSKTAFVFAVLATFVSLVYLIQQKLSTQKLILFFGISITILSCLILFTRFFYYSRFNFSSELTIPNEQVTKGNSIRPRMAAHSAGYYAIKQKPFLGYGTGSGNAILQKTFPKLGYTQLAQQDMHTHSQYVRTALDLGVFALAYVLFYLMYLFRQLWQQKQLFTLLILLLLLVNMLTDDAFEIQAIIVPCLFFLYLLYFRSAYPLHQAKTL